MNIQRTKVFLALISLMVLGAWILMTVRGIRSRQHAMPDGSTVYLRSVSYGTTHRFPVGTWWQQLVFRILPAKYAARLPTLVYQQTNNEPTLVLWLEHITPDAYAIHYGGHPAFADPPDWQGLYDESGTDFEAYSAEVFARTPRGAVQGVVLHALPVASQSLSFRYVYSNAIAGAQYTTVFSFPNPAYRKASEVKYGSGVDQEGLRLSLTDFRSLPRHLHRPFKTTCSFDLFEDGKPASGWMPCAIEVRDVNGAVYHPYTTGWGWRGNTFTCDFVGGLSTNSPWLLRVCFRRETFASNEICTATDIPVLGDYVQPITSRIATVNGTPILIRSENTSPAVTLMIKPPDETYYLNILGVTTNATSMDPKAIQTMFQSDSDRTIYFSPGVTNTDLRFGVMRKVFLTVGTRPGS